MEATPRLAIPVSLQFAVHFTVSQVRLARGAKGPGRRHQLAMPCAKTSTVNAHFCFPFLVTHWGRIGFSVSLGKTAAVGYEGYLWHPLK